MNAALVIMAAGLGSRYGGIKQITGLGPKGEILMEYAAYDAIQAGFDRIILVVKDEILEDVKTLCGDRLAKQVELCYAIQRLTDVPAIENLPQGRTKPYGTVQAVLAAASYIDRPFAVINADDYYGRDAFEKIYADLQSLPGQGVGNMVGYRLKNAVSENGSVTRGICHAQDGLLQRVVETYGIRPEDGDIVDENGNKLEPDCLVSMNYWGFMPSIIPAMRKYFEDFLRALPPEEIKKECLLPTMVDDMIRAGTLSIRVLSTPESWFGVTYQADRAEAMKKLAALHAAGVYPQTLR